MNEENSGSFLQVLQGVIEREGVFVEELLLGVIVLRFWGEAGKKKEPEEVLYRPYVARPVREIQGLKTGSQ